MGWALALLLTGCASGPVSSLRFENRAPAWNADDRRPIPKPAATEGGHMAADVQALLRRPVLQALAVPERPRAMNVNSLGGVPDSTWFENRIGVRELRVDEIERGPNGSGIDRSMPLSVHEAEDEWPPRFVVEDARGGRYILKFDLPDQAELETSAEVVSQRLLWAAGYHVPENEIVELDRRQELVVAQGATYEVRGGPERALREQDLDTLLARVARTPDGKRFRGMASKYLRGEPIGGYPMHGVRPDDPNDRVPHQHRRDVRGQELFFAWLGHTDVKRPNTLDTWVQSPTRPGLGFVMHHLVDFGKSLGVWGRDSHHEHDGFSSHFDYGYAVRSLLAFGLWKRPWEGIDAPALRGVGRFEARRFDPDLYAPANSYEPFLYTDELDRNWAAQIIARFRPEHIRAAVRMGKYSDPRAAAYISRTLIARQREIVREVLPRVASFDRLRASRDTRAGGVRVCARDLTVAYGLVPAWGTRYELAAYDHQGRELGDRRELSGLPSGELCATGIGRGGRRDGYVLLSVRTFRGSRELDPVVIHVARHPVTAAPRVIGLDRPHG